MLNPVMELKGITKDLHKEYKEVLIAPQRKTNYHLRKEIL